MKKKPERNRVNGNDIPHEYTKDFNERLVPFLRAAVGTMTPFTIFELAYKQKIFKIVFPWSDVKLDASSVFARVVSTSMNVVMISLTSFCADGKQILGMEEQVS